MAEGTTRRRLAAILAADVVGYSRLVGLDEAGTLSALRALRKELVEPALKRHRGRVVKLMGDGLLAEFESVVDAVTAAAEIQRALPARFADLPEDRRIRIRIGVNLGDVVVEGRDLLGDGVNIAARLQEIAPVGGIAVSDAAHLHLGGRVDLVFTDTGPRELKNIVTPIRVWRWDPEAAAAPPADSESLSLPEKPSIAVLPFANMSDDAEQEYFADGTAEDIITSLSCFHQLFVIARNSSFVFRGRNVDIKQVGRELGVRYVLEGSVRKSRDRIRINAQLIEAESGGHLWAERYDRRIDDLFDLQDEITEAIVGRIEPEIRRSEARRGERRPTDSLPAHDCYYQGLSHIHGLTPEGFARGRALLEQATRLDPRFAAAHAAAAWSYLLEYVTDPRAASKELSGKGLALSEAAVALDNADPFGQVILATWMMLVENRLDECLSLMTRALETNPNLAFAWQFRGRVHVWRGEADEGVACIERAMRLSPNDPFGYLQQSGLCLAHFAAARYEDAMTWGARAFTSNPRYLASHALYAASAAMLGRLEEAGEARERLVRLDPEISVAFFDNVMASMHSETRTRLLDAMRRAGLPE